MIKDNKRDSGHENIYTILCLCPFRGPNVGNYCVSMTLTIRSMGPMLEMIVPLWLLPLDQWPKTIGGREEIMVKAYRERYHCVYIFSIRLIKIYIHLVGPMGYDWNDHAIIQQIHGLKAMVEKERDHCKSRETIVSMHAWSADLDVHLMGLMTDLSPKRTGGRKTR